MIKQPLTPTKAQRITISLEKIVIVAKVLWMEAANELDADFKMPVLNQFAKRIISDSEAINKHLEKQDWFDKSHKESAEEYAGEMWRVVDLLCGLDIELIKEFADNLDRRLKLIEV